MKQLINCLIYDTNKATELCRVKSGVDYSSQGWVFYKTSSGKLFKERTYWRCAYDTGNLSESNETEMLEILVQFNSPELNKFFPNLREA